MLDLAERRSAQRRQRRRRGMFGCEARVRLVAFVGIIEQLQTIRSDGRSRHAAPIRSEVLVLRQLTVNGDGSALPHVAGLACGP